jgi:FkbM family methyltransferase
MVELQPHMNSGTFADLCTVIPTRTAVQRVRRDRPTLVQRLCQHLPPIFSARLFHTFIEQRWERAGRPFVSRTVTDALYGYRTGDALADKVRMCGYWDWRNLAVAAIVCADGDQIIEIGANTGTETIGFSKIAGARGRVCAFEPEPSLLAAVRSNVQLNGFSNVVMVAAAVADRNRSVNFTRPTSVKNSGIGHIASASDTTGDIVEVPAVTLDSIADDLGAASLIAVDVEGYEGSVLRGAVEYIRRFQPALVLEVCPKLMRRTGDDLEQLIGQLNDLEYEAFEIGKFCIRRVDPAHCVAPDYEANWLCLRRGHADVTRKIREMFLKCAFTPNIGGLHPLSRVARARS